MTVPTERSSPGTFVAKRRAIPSSGWMRRVRTLGSIRWPNSSRPRRVGGGVGRRYHVGPDGARHPEARDDGRPGAEVDGVDEEAVVPDPEETREDPRDAVAAVELGEPLEGPEPGVRLRRGRLAAAGGTEVDAVVGGEGHVELGLDAGDRRFLRGPSRLPPPGDHPPEDVLDGGHLPQHTGRRTVASPDSSKGQAGESFLYLMRWGWSASRPSSWRRFSM